MQYRLWGRSLLLGITQSCWFQWCFTIHRSLVWKADPRWERFLVGCILHIRCFFTICIFWKAPLPLVIPFGSQRLRAQIDSRFCGCHPFCLVVLVSSGPSTCGCGYTRTYNHGACPRFSPSTLLPITLLLTCFSLLWSAGLMSLKFYPRALCAVELPESKLRGFCLGYQFKLCQLIQLITSIYLSIHPSIHPSIYLFICDYICDIKW